MRALRNWDWARVLLLVAMAAVAYAVWAATFTSIWFDDAEEFLVWFAIAISLFGVYEVLVIWLGSPDVAIEPAATQGTPIADGKFAIQQLLVWNFDLPAWLRPLFLRAAPEGCQVRVCYTNTETHEVLFGGEWFLARWNDNREPVNDAGTGISIPAMIENRRLRSRLFPSEQRGHRNANPFSVAFAIKRDGEDDFYHFNDDSYQWAGAAGWANPKWRIGKGSYRVDIEVTGYGLHAPATATARLTNNGPTFGDFMLVPWK